MDRAQDEGLDNTANAQDEDDALYLDHWATVDQIDEVLPLFDDLKGFVSFQQLWFTTSAVYSDWPASCRFTLQHGTLVAADKQ